VASAVGRGSRFTVWLPVRTVEDGVLPVDDRAHLERPVSHVGLEG
jgi:hypothetical protein